MKTAKGQTRLADVLEKSEKKLLSEWLVDLRSTAQGMTARISEEDLAAQAHQFLKLLRESAQHGTEDVDSADWAPVHSFLEEVSRSRATQGFTSDQTATFIFSFKRPLFAALRKEVGSDADALMDATWSATELLDKLGLLTIKTFQQSREAVIRRQQ